MGILRHSLRIICSLAYTIQHHSLLSRTLSPHHAIPCGIVKSYLNRKKGYQIRRKKQKLCLYPKKLQMTIRASKELHPRLQGAFFAIGGADIAEGAMNVVTLVLNEIVLKGNYQPFAIKVEINLCWDTYSELPNFCIIDAINFGIL